MEKDADDGRYTPIQKPETRYVRDEQIEFFHPCFLLAATSTTVPFHTRWVTERNSMIFRKNVQYSYVAGTDGRLRNDKNRSFGLIGVKPRKG